MLPAFLAVTKYQGMERLGTVVRKDCIRCEMWTIRKTLSRIPCGQCIPTRLSLALAWVIPVRLPRPVPAARDRARDGLEARG